jgi:hypothetical protein
MKTLDEGVLTGTVNRFMSGAGMVQGEDRARSWDFCYEHFRDTDRVQADLQASCMQLGYYLASWGMLRGSTYLFKNTNARHYLGALKVIAEHDAAMRAITPEKYVEADAQEVLVRVYDELRNALIPRGATHLTLITKTMMGVWGVVPSFDTYFMRTFRGLATPGSERGAMRRFGTDTIELLGEFYGAHRKEIDALAAAHTTVDFRTGATTGRPIPAAKVIDIFGFGKTYYPQDK